MDVGQPKIPGRGWSIDTEPQRLNAVDRNIRFEQYKLLVNSTLETSARRHSSDTEFPTVNTGMFAGLGGASAAGFDLLRIGWKFFISMCGLMLC